MICLCALGSSVLGSYKMVEVSTTAIPGRLHMAQVQAGSVGELWEGGSNSCIWLLVETIF